MTMPAHPVTGHAISRLLRRYRLQLLFQTGLLLGLGAGCVAALGWRLWLLGVRPSIIAGIGLAAMAVLGWWQRRALRRLWAARAHTPLALDRALGLEARLITAAEFADRPQPPPLYARLMEDPVLVRPLSSMRLSPLANRRTGLLAAALLLLLLWPWRAPLLPQLAKQIPSPSMPPEMPPQPPPPTKPGTPPPGGGVGAGSPEAEGRRTSTQSQAPQPSGSQQQQSSGGSGDQSQSQQHSSSPQSAQPSNGAQQQHAKAAGGESEQRPQEQTGKAGQPGSAESQQGAEPFDSAQGSALSNVERAEQARAGQENAGAQAQSGTAAAAAAATQQLTAAQPRPASGRGQQEALKANIQQMLQELSTELEQMQKEFQHQRADQPNPAPGTSTDPELFEDASKLEPATGGPLPIQLGVDAQSTSRTRRGGGSGAPSTEAVDAPFQVQAESAELAESGAEAAAGQRQAIPPEYRPVFERLSRTNQQPPP